MFEKPKSDGDYFEQVLFKVWETLCPPVSEESIKGNWYAVIYRGKKVPHLFVGCVTRRSLQDVNGPIAAIELLCLKETIGCCEGDNILEVNSTEHPDIAGVSDVIAGPLVCAEKGRGKDVESCSLIKEIFENVKTLNRVAIYIHILDKLYNFHRK